ncbi:MAG: RpiB/LacA/LacB family sugar-phosphate isomerase [Candidatus Aenigmatarchaeota archaeon]
MPPPKAEVYMGCDLHGSGLRLRLMPFLTGMGYALFDMGEHEDFPVAAGGVCDGVLYGMRDGRRTQTGPMQPARSRFGVLICGSGQGMAVAANKFPGIRAAMCNLPGYARQAREHLDANVLTMGADYMRDYARMIIGFERDPSRRTEEAADELVSDRAYELARETVRTFLETGFDGLPKHSRRIGMITDLEGDLRD